MFFLAESGLRCRTWAFSSCCEWGLLFVVVCGLLTKVDSLLQSTGSRRGGFSSFGVWLSCSAACGIFPDQGSNLCPLAGGFLTTVPPGKPPIFKKNYLINLFGFTGS